MRDFNFLSIVSISSRGEFNMKTTRKFAVLVMMMAIALVASACGGGGGDGASNPGDAVGGVIEALFEGDADALSNYICEDLQDEAAAVGEEAAAGLGDLGDVDIDLNLEYTVTDETDTTANVTVGGTIGVSVAGESIEQDASALFGDTQIPVIKEGDNWVVCDQALLEGGF